MGVMNITPNSFSDGAEVLTPESFMAKLSTMGELEALDIGAESTAPMNESISWQTEWQRWQMVLPLLKTFPFSVSADTYHAETIFNLIKFFKDHKLKNTLFWNDVSGKFDESVREYLSLSENFHYVFCHNRAPTRELSGRHMNYVQEGNLKEELCTFFSSHLHPRVIFDPCLGFSKSYDENWWILDNFKTLQTLIPHKRWLLGFSRKSFLRKKIGLVKMEKEKLDHYHGVVLKSTLVGISGEIWVRTHRPDLIEV